MKGFTSIKNILDRSFASSGQDVIRAIESGVFVLKSPCFIALGIGLSLIPATNRAFAAGVVGNGTAASCTEAALNAALADGGIVTFNCGSSPATIKINSEKLISSDTLIDGRGLITIDGGGITRIFKTADSGVPFSVSGLTIANGFTTDEGGGIFSGYRGKLTVVNCKFINNISTKGGPFDGGGAIYIKSESTVIVDKSTFTGNRANNGGAINNLLSDLTVTNSTFTTNKSVVSGSGSGGGGAIYIDGGNGNTGKIVLRGNTFTNNTSIHQGGAINVQLYNSNTMAIENSTINGNKVTGAGDNGFGGGIFIAGGTVSGITGYTGGSNNTVLNVANTTFAGNTASNQGGGLWSGNNVAVNISNSTLHGNRAVSADSKGGGGGGIMITSGNANITNSTIANNYAGFQGGGIIGGANVKLLNTIIANNKANNGGNNWNIKNNCFDQMTNGGNNLQFPARNLSDPSDKDCVAGILTADPKLGALGNNGGSTQTVPLLAGSAAINAGNIATCPSTDQRGVARPQGGTCDIGAVEAR